MRWVPALLVLCLLGGAWAIWRLDPGAAAPPADSTATPRSELAGGGTATAVTASGDAPSLRDDDDGSGQAIETSEREDGALATGVAGQPGGPTLLVVRGDPPQPVARADVWFLPERDLDRHNRNTDGRITRWEGPELFGRRTRTDERGLAQLPPGRDRWLCAASMDGEFGFLAASPRPRQYTIRLGPDEPLSIEAAFADGEPALVPIAILQQIDGNDPNQRGENDTPIWHGSTDARGRSVVRHFQLVRRAAATDPSRAAEERFLVVAKVPTTTPAVAAFAGRPAPAEPVRLVVPPLGRIEVTLVDHRGKPLLTPASLGFGVEGPPVPDTGTSIMRGLLSQRVDKPAGTDPVTLPFAEVGGEVQVHARYPSERRAARSDRVPGPQQLGEPVRIMLRPLDRHCVFAGRLLTRAQQPIVADRVEVSLWRDDVVQQTPHITTIVNGCWDLVLSASTDPANWRMEFRCDAPAAGDEVARRVLGTTVTLPPWPPGQRIELGDVVLDDLPPLAQGIVVDDQAQPVAGATVTIQQERARPPGRPMAGTPGPSGLPSLPNVVINTRSQGPRDPWRSLPQLRTETAADGSFVLHGAMPPGTLRVLADSNRHFAASVELSAPNRNLRIQIARNGILRGRVLLPPWIADGAVTLTMQSFDAAHSSVDPRAGKVQSNGAFVVEPLQPGRYDVSITMRNLLQPIATVPDVLIAAGENQDPRFAPLDLGQALYRYRLRALDQASQPLPLDGPIHARLQRTDGSFVEAGFRWQQGRAELITAHPLAECTFFGRGFEPQRQQLGPGDHAIYLRTLQPALLQVPGARALCGPVRKVRISVILQGDTGYPGSLGGVDQRSGDRFSFARWDLGRSSGGWLEDSDVVSIPLMQAGRYEVILRAHATDSTATRQVSVSLGEHELRPDSLSIVTVPLDAAALGEVLRRIDEQYAEQQGRRQQRRGAPR